MTETWLLIAATCARLASGGLECKDITASGPFPTMAACVEQMQRDAVPGLRLECRRFG